MKILFRKTIALAALLGASLAASQSQAAVCTYAVTAQWDSGFIGSITITNNTSTTINDWSVNWQYSKNTLVNHFNADLSGSNPYTAKALAWNKVIQPGGYVSFGFQGSNNGGAPELPVVNGAVCSTVIGSSSSSSSSKPNPSSSSLSSLSSFSSSVSVSRSSSSAVGCNIRTCVWYGSSYPVCDSTTSGWGYENGKSCIAAATCSAQTAPNGLYLSPGCPVSSSSARSSSSSSLSSTPVDYYCNGNWQFTPCSSSSSPRSSSSSSRSSSSILGEYVCNGVMQRTPCSSSSRSSSSSSINYEYFCGNVIQNTPCSSSSRSSSSSSIIVDPPANPFTGATWYINPEWQAKALSEPGGFAIANNNTAVWLDRIAAIAPTDGSMGLAAHLDAALSQHANLITLVIYDLPNRDCKALASNGELTINGNGFNRYKNEYITPIVSILSQTKYKGLRIIAIIEPDSLPNLVTNASNPKCQEAAGAGGYIEATQFTLNQLYPLNNVYSYLDIGHSGWLGWPDNLAAATTLISNAVKGTTHGVNSIRGFVSNTAGYTPNTEPFLDDLSNSPLPGSNGGSQVRQAKFYEWNPYFSEIGFVQAWRAQMIAKGFPSTIGMLIDTSRNGWGGTGRPKVQSTSTLLDTFVDESRLDRRLHRGNWCNQAGGIGERPRATNIPGIDAYVWVKPPGESDGASSLELSYDPNDPAKGFDRYCDPTYSVPGAAGTGALSDAPVAGRWFSKGFQTLLKNAYPPLLAQ